MGLFFGEFQGLVLPAHLLLFAQRRCCLCHEGNLTSVSFPVHFIKAFTILISLSDSFIILYQPAAAGTTKVSA